MPRWCIRALLAAALAASGPALLAQSEASSAAQGSAEAVARLERELRELRREYEERLRALEVRLRELQAGQAQAAPVAPPAPPPPSVAASSSKIFNPDIAVIGDFLGAVGRHRGEAASPALELHEAEASFQAAVDPYARADFFFSFSPEGVEVEEGFVTFPTLPGKLLLKAGKLRASFGR